MTSLQEIQPRRLNPVRHRHLLLQSLLAATKACCHGAKSGTTGTAHWGFTRIWILDRYVPKCLTTHVCLPQIA